MDSAKEQPLDNTEITSPNKFKLIHKKTPGDTSDVDFKVEPSKTRYIYTNFIDNSLVAPLAKSKLNIKLEITPTATPTQLKNYQVYRVIVDQAYPKFVPLNGTIDNNKVVFTEDVKSDNTTSVKGPFRVLYIIQSKDSVKPSHVVVNTFTVKGQDIAENDKNNKGIQSLANVNLKYEQAVCVNGNQYIDNICQLPNFNQITEIKCNMATGCNNIFDRQLPTSVQTQPPQTDPARPVRFVSFRLEKGQTEDHVLEINPSRGSADKKPDLCVTFSYRAKTTPLHVKSDANNFNVISLPLTPESSKEPIQITVCASDFTENLNSVTKLIFYFAGAELDIDNHYVQFTKIDIEQPDKDDLVLDTGVYISNLDLKQFSGPSSHWKAENDAKKFTNTLTYSFDVNDLKAPAFKPNSKAGTAELYYEKLRTKWIKMPVEGANFKFGLTLKMADSSVPEGYFVNEKTVVKVISSRSTPKSYLLARFSNDNVFTLDKSLPASEDGKSTSEHYLLEIKVTLNVTEIKSVAADKLKPIKLVIENLNLNDPCITGATVSTLEKCHNDEVDSSGKSNTCVRGYNETDFRPICKCISGYKGETCEKKDYCLRQSALCLGKKCENDYIFNGVSCQCNTGESWNPFLKGCINANDLICKKEFTRPKYDRVLHKTTCVCLDDYIEVKVNATVTACVPFEPCKEEHRTKLRLPVACPNANATCEPTGSKIKPTDFQCNCATGFINQRDVHTSEAKCLPAVCASCTNSCKTTDEKTYKCDATFCDEKGGYDFNKTSKECTFSAVKFGALLKCGQGVLAIEKAPDGKPACKCEPGQKLDLDSRNCSPTECDNDAVKACKDRGAPTCTFTGGKAQCVCKSTDIPYATDQHNASDWKCISKCDLIEKPDFYEARCTKSFEHCNNNTKMTPAALRSGSAPTLDAVNPPYNTKIFVYNVTKVDLSSGKPHCACNTGFYRDTASGDCYPSTIPTHTITGFEFDLIHTSNEHEYIEKVRLAFMKLVAFVLEIKDPKNLDSATNCVKSADEKSLLCSTSFQSPLSNDVIKKKLADACVHVDADKNKCFYVVEPTKLVPYGNFLTRSAFDESDLTTFADPPSTTNDVLIHNPNVKPGVTTKEYCSKTKNICSSFAYSVCVPDEKKIKPFECLCPKDKPFFKVIDSKTIPAPGANKKPVELTMETCGIVNMCDVDKKKYGCKAGAQCHFQVELDEKNEYQELSYCKCNNSSITFSDRELSCEKSCTNYCGKNAVSCGQDYLDTKRIVCNCKEGFIGAKCEKKATEAKKEAEASSSKAYLISTIVVSVIAAIALIGLAVLYFKRR